MVTDVDAWEVASVNAKCQLWAMCSDAWEKLTLHLSSIKMLRIAIMKCIETLRKIKKEEKEKIVIENKINQKYH